jgi:hypothetical protein
MASPDHAAAAYHSHSRVAKTCYAWPVVPRIDFGLFVLAFPYGVAVASGCGRRATEDDCRLIVDRSVELQMKEMSRSDTAAIADREQRVRAALEDEIKACETRRVTSKTMACVRTASTMKELDACLR